MRFLVTNEGTLLACLLTLFLCRAGIASAIVPPWQGPDEPIHFGLTRLLAMEDGTTQQANLEQRVIQSMARHRWWEPYREITPDPLPRSFYVMGGRLGGGTYDQPLYYGLGAFILRLAQPVDLEAAYRILQALNVVLIAAALVFGWVGTRLLFDSLTAAGATALAVLSPQFLLTALTVSPDALVILLGAAIWWLAARIVRGHRRGFSIALLVIGAVAALMTKRSAIPLAAVAGIVTFATIGAYTRRLSRPSVVAGSLALLVAAGTLMLAWQLYHDNFRRLVAFWWTGLNFRRGPEEMTVASLLRMIPQSIDHAWLTVSIARLQAPETWLWIARVLTVGGFAGAAVLMARRQAWARHLWLPWIFVAFQMAAVYAIAIRNVVLPEARFIFPVFAPAFALMWTGWIWLVPAPIRPRAPILLIASVAILDVTAFTIALIPAYVG